LTGYPSSGLRLVYYLPSCPEEVGKAHQDDSCLVAQLTENVGSTYVPIPNLPNINALQNMSGDISRGNGTEEVTQYYD